MPKTVEIDGYGPVTIRGLPKDERAYVAVVAACNPLLVLAEYVRRGCIRPDLWRMPDDELQREFGHRPDSLEAIVIAIVELSEQEDA